MKQLLNLITFQQIIILALLICSLSSIDAQISDPTQKARFDEIEKMTQQFYDKGDFVKTLAYVQEGMEIVQQYYSKEDTMYIQYCNNFGSIHRRLANHKESEKYYREAQEMAAKGMGKKSNLYAESTNGLAMLYNEMGRFDETEKMYMEVLLIQEEIFGKEHKNYANTTNNLASLYNNKGMFEKAIPLFNQTITIRAKTLGKEHQLYAEALNNLGGCHKEMGNEKEAELLYVEAKNILAKTLGKQHPNYAGIVNNLAYLYVGMGYFEQAEPLFLEALAAWEQLLGKEHPYYAKGITNLGILHATKKDYERASVYFEQACAVRAKIYGKQHPDYATSLNNLSAVYTNALEYKKAEKVLLEVLDIRIKVFGKIHPIYASTLNNLAHVYNKNKQLEKALPMYLESIDVNQKIYGKHHQEIASTINSLAVAFESRDSLEDALKYVLMALEAVSLNWTLEEIKYPTCLDNIHQVEVNSKSVLLKILNTLRGIEKRYYRKTKDLAHLEQSYRICKLILELNEQYRQEFSTEEDKLHFLSEGVPYINEGIRLAAELDELDNQKQYHIDAFAMAEQNKSVLLTGALKAQRARTFGGLPENLATQEQTLQKELSKLKKELLSATDEAKKNSLRAELNELNQTIEGFKKELESKYPKYFKAKYEAITATAVDIQKVLLKTSNSLGGNNKTALLEYFVSDSCVYLFCITTDTVMLLKLNIPKELLKQNTKILRQVLSDYAFIRNNSNAVWDTYTKVGYWFYAELVEKALKSIKPVEHLVIISDGELGHLPFEAFLTKKVDLQKNKQDYKTLSYLLNNYKVSYNYSATLFKENSAVEQATSSGKMLAFAASYGTDIKASSVTRGGDLLDLRSQLVPLPAVQTEVKRMEELFEGTFLYKEQANEQQFKKLAVDFDVLHLAMHGILNTKFPILSSMAFTENGDSLEDNFLQAYEISNMHINAKLVVLSACETGYGKFEQGEGVLSLARSFMYAGVPSLVVSLWQVNDGSTAAIMASFYENLADGMPKDVALRQAKLDYIDKAKGITAHPAFWSPFIQLGDSRAILVAKRNSFSMLWLFGGAGVLLLLLAGLVVARRKK